MNIHVGSSAEINALIVVVNRNAQSNFRIILADDIFVQMRFNLLRLRQRLVGTRGFLFGVAARCTLLNDFPAKFNALIAYTNTGTGNQLVNFILRFTAERTANGLFSAVVISRHDKLTPL